MQGRSLLCPPPSPYASCCAPAHRLCPPPQHTRSRSELEDALSYERFAAAYSAAKSYVCCDLLNYAGGLWLAALLVGAAGLPTALAAFAWVARMDRLEPRG